MSEVTKGEKGDEKPKASKVKSEKLKCKKKTATKRRIGTELGEIKTFDVFTAFNKDGGFKNQPKITQFESDEEEDLEEFKAKLNKKQSKSTKSKAKTKSQRRRYSDSDTDDEVACLTSSTNNKDHQPRHLDSPSPPPSPEFDDKMMGEIMMASRGAANVIQHLESAMMGYRVAKRMAEIENGVSPVMGSPSEIIDVEAIGPRDSTTVKVRSRQGLRRYDHHMEENFQKIFEDLARLEGVEPNRVKMTRKAEDINEQDTPRSINLHIADILDYVIVDVAPAVINYSILDESDFVMIRLRTNKKNSDLTRRLAKMEPLGKILKEFAQVNQRPLSGFRFLFDGDPVSPENTPEQLDMDEENVIDVEVV